MISRELLVEALLGMFELAPTAICISTAEVNDGRYLRVNQAYLDLVGRTWADLRNERLTDAGAVLSEARRRRLRLLDEVGFYKSEEVEIRHASGRIVPTLISAQRSILDGEAVDIEIIIDISDRMENERKLTAAALTDVLTGLPNRAAFDRHLGAEIARRSQDGVLSLAFIDLNGFKAVNDRYGHGVGDAFLRVVAQRLRSRSRVADFVGRIGGDEFGIVFRAIGGDADTLLARIRELATDIFAPVRVASTVLAAGAAIGIALSQEGDDAEALLRRADEAMYAAKRTGERVAVRMDAGAATR